MNYEDYPPDGTPFEMTAEVVDLLYRAVRGAPALTKQERDKARLAVDFIAAAQLTVPAEEGE